MDNFVIFVSGRYGRSIDTFINRFFDLLCQEYPKTAEFEVPDGTKEYFHSFSFAEETEMISTLLSISRDQHVNNIFVFNRSQRSLSLHKGAGEVNELLDFYENKIHAEYQGAFSAVFQYAYYQDARPRSLHYTLN